MTGTIGNRPPTERIETCDVGHRYWSKDAVVADGWYGPRCAACCDFQTFSDLYKDEVGVRPHFEVTVDFVAGWLRSVGVEPAVDYIEPVK